ncbi:MAG: hypothetical protein ETSY1_39815 [Candidatus Entotheonella factor]|uniref:Glycoside hydrolase family 57 N-terminal domain-containing protein n=1 Tax=Entotheonella factor TaxID=1429438 RepID=W4L7K5_ENTF1|nr:MAG: hypothetical protein ETSY1_39815 [Candidatus Entotheonella factor]
MKLGLIISNDWELFGDGSGNYFEVQHRPLEALLQTVEDHGAPLTVMAEVAQQWAHQRIAPHTPWARDVVAAWEAILQETVARGSDVQLHLHPQWLQARYEQDAWQVDYDQWAIGDLEPTHVEAVLREGKHYLERLLQPVQADYECIAFRAGAYCIEPSHNVIPSLQKLGFLCDSSVTKGLYQPQYYDYRDAHGRLVPWFVSPSSVKYKHDCNEGLLEIPIYAHESVDSPLLRKFLSPWLFYRMCFGVGLSQQDQHWIAAKNKRLVRYYPVLKRKVVKNNITSFKWLLSKILVKSALQLDYDSLPPMAFVKCLQHIFASQAVRSEQEEVILPVMASGHVKEVPNFENLHRILDGVHRHLRDQVVYWNLRDAVKYWLNLQMA